jgi:hypothetical protein
MGPLRSERSALEMFAPAPGRLAKIVFSFTFAALG